MSRIREVTAIMLTQNKKRQQLVRMSMHSFFGQTYPHRRLLIINSGIPIFTEDNPPPPNVKEVVVEYDPKMTIGELRNIGLEHCETELFIAWDDDDWRREDFLQTMADAYEEGTAVCLRRLTNYDMVNNKIYVMEMKEGTVALSLQPKDRRRYPHTMFCEGVFKEQGPYKILDNDPQIFVRLYHGDNVCGDGVMNWDGYRNTIEISVSDEVNSAIRSICDVS